MADPRNVAMEEAMLRREQEREMLEANPDIRSALNVYVVPSEYKQGWIDRVNQSMHEPVLQVAPLAGNPLFDRLSRTGNGAEMLAQRHPTGKMSLYEFGLYQAIGEAMDYATEELGVPEDGLRQWLASPEGEAAYSDQYDKWQKGMTNMADPTDSVRTAKAYVQMHTPGAPFAEQPQRTDSEAAALSEEYGKEAEFVLSDQGSRDSYRALAVHELLSAADPDYVAGGTSSAILQSMQMPVDTNPFPSPLAGFFNPQKPDEVTLDNREQIRLRGQPDGKYAIASMYWDRQPQDNSQNYSIYDEAGRPRFANKSTTTLPGIANTMYSSSYPLGYLRQMSTPLRQPSTFLSAAMDGEPGYATGIAAANVARNRITPQRPDAMDPKDFQIIADSAADAEAKGDDWNSAYFGPMFADSANTMTEPFRKMGVNVPSMQRTYLSPMAQEVFRLPEEMLTDPVNLSTLAVPPAIATSAAAFGRGGNLVRRLKNIAKVGGVATRASAGTLSDDVIQEAPLSAMMVTAANEKPFSPSKTNALMNDKDPNDPDYDDEFRMQHYLLSRQNRAIGSEWNKRSKQKEK